MSKMITTLNQKFDGSWRCETNIALGNDCTMQISTAKNREGISTTVIVGNMDNGTFTTRLFQDFSKIIEYPKRTHNTKENIKKLHAQVLTDIDNYLDEAKAHYEK